jgi:ribonuclease H2 subunit A
MVYACCFWPSEESEVMKKEFGFTDSKMLKEEDRDRLFHEIN